MALQTFAKPVSKDVDGVVDKLTNNPFNIYSVSQEKNRKTPTAFFGEQSKRLVNMSPNDYYKFVAHQINTTPEKLMNQRSKVANDMSIEDMRAKMREGVQFDTPWLRLMDSGEKGTVRPYWQEGLHRMLAAGQEYGMDTKFPTYIAYDDDPWYEIDTLSMDDFINHYDKKRLERYNRQKQSELDEEEKDKNWWTKETADHFKVPVDKVTPEMIKEYEKYMDDLFSIADLKELL